MKDKKKLIQAKKIYKIMCDFFDEKKLAFDKEEDKLNVRFTLQSNDLPIDFYMEVETEKDIINLYCKLPFAFKDEKRMDGALATSLINYRMYDGSFDYKFESGEVFLRLTSTYKDCTVSKDLINYMMNSACKTLDEYSDKLLALSEGKITLEVFNNKIKTTK